MYSADSEPVHDAASTRDGHVPHPLHPDIPPVAATESGGPGTSPGELERPHTWKYEAVEGFFIQTGPEPKHVEFEDLVSCALHSSKRCWWR